VYTGTSNKKQTIYTNPQLLTMPLPDFTMPYNVVTLTCTLLAFFFGCIFNLFTRKFYYGKQKKTLQTVIEKMKKLWERKREKQL
jgi:hypothetical protein